MILYQLRCAGDHRFEAWFRDGATYDTQRVTGEVACPICGDTDVAKAPMAPAVSRAGVVPKEKVVRHVVEAARKLRQHVEESCDYVGDQFAEEARRIHYGEQKERGIYGEATEVESAELDEEGISFGRLPHFPRRND